MTSGHHALRLAPHEPRALEILSLVYDAPETRGLLLREYRATNRGAVWAMCVGSSVFVILTSWSDHGPWSLLVVTGLVPLAWFLAERPRMQLYSEGMSSRGPLREAWVNRTDVDAVEIAYPALLVQLQQGATLRVWAVQQPRMKLLWARQTKAERIAECIERWVAGEEVRR